MILWVNEVAMARHGPILNHNAATGCRKVSGAYRIPYNIQKWPQRSKNSKLNFPEVSAYLTPDIPPVVRRAVGTAPVTMRRSSPRLWCASARVHSCGSSLITVSYQHPSHIRPSVTQACIGCLPPGPYITAAVPNFYMRNPRVI